MVPPEFDAREAGFAGQRTELLGRDEVQDIRPCHPRRRAARRRRPFEFLAEPDRAGLRIVAR
jgi:hypothetical protein